MPGIVVSPRESFDEAYRKFKKQCDRNLIVTWKQGQDSIMKSQLRDAKKRKLAQERKFLKNFIC